MAICLYNSQGLINCMLNSTTFPDNVLPLHVGPLNQRPTLQPFMALKTVLFLTSSTVLLVFICIKRDIWNSLKNSQFCDRRDRSDREGLFEQEERLKRKRKHRKSQSSKAQKFAEKYQLNDSEILLYQSP